MIGQTTTNPARPTAPLLDWHAGTIAVGLTADQHPAHYRLHTPRGAAHGIAYGTTATGRSTLLHHLVTAEAASGHVDTWVADPVGDLSDLAEHHTGYYAGGLDEAAALMHTLDRAIELRTLDAHTQPDGQWTPTGPHPLLSVTVNDWDVLIAEYPSVVNTAERIAALGRRTGIALRIAVHRPGLENVGTARLRDTLAAGTVVALRLTEPCWIPGLRPGDADASELPVGVPGLAYVTGTGAAAVHLWRPEDTAGQPAAVASAFPTADAAEKLGAGYLGWRDRLAARRRGEPAAVPVA
ncbi:hypothetical protein AB0C76_33015 [Kitasatospora sp. NPDC048722]|uniref:hypothetical protein n=1 Tax=Kitasatospora sp. NPDC048722 TaxID=3155639 RepID=UPI003409D61F